MSSDDGYKLRPVKLPDDESFYERPFFAYGIFKEGQLAHARIKDYVERVEPDDIPRKMHIRDGMPVITGEDDAAYITKGDKIFFNDKNEEAYEAISSIQPGNIYKWSTVDIDKEPFNVLITDEIGGTFVNVDKEGKYIDEFDGHNDPFFSRVPSFIREELAKIDYEDEDSVFRIQMLYTLLWSAIDRYCTLKYEVSNRQNDYLKSLSEDEVFIEAFNIIRPKARKPIHSAKNASTYYFNLKKENFIVNFYYTIRCNVVHRGKESGNNIEALEDSLNDLLNIFNKMIEITFQRQ